MDDPVVYAGRLKDRDGLMHSSSGGVFTAISDWILDERGAVACSIYDFAKHTTEFRLVTTRAQRDAARGSKYVQSRPADIFSVCEQWLRSNPEKPLLFVGVGCQADAFKNYLEIRGLRERAYIADMICHGSPSPALWRQYIKVLEKKAGGTTTYLSFRDKRTGWQHSTAVALIGEKEISLKPYMKVYSSRNAMRPCCYVCPFAKISRSTDLTIGDFWHIENTIPDFFDPLGTSVILLHTDKGMRMFQAVSDSIDFRQSNAAECWQDNLTRPTARPAERERFWKDYQKRGAGYIMNKYGVLLPAARAYKRKINKLWRTVGGVFSNW